MTPSIIKQVPAEFVDVSRFNPSPRNYNASICRLNDKVWMAYRSHRMDRDGRCEVAICLMKGAEPLDSQWLDLGGATGNEHQEDPRLFVFKGSLHVSYSETTFPKGRDYIAVQKYARLKRVGGKWKVAEVFRPHYGDNYAGKMEKNWQFFERDGRLYAIYESAPRHVVIELDGDQVVKEYITEGVSWPWGEIRGGTPPLPHAASALDPKDQRFITFFHSSTPLSEEEGGNGNWRRYWMGAYVFDADFKVTHISPEPIAGGSEEDNHGLDPRTKTSWKPFVVFPGGAVPTHTGWDVCMGINDWRIAIAHLSEPKLMRVDEVRPAKYLMTTNASRPILLMRFNRDPYWHDWDNIIPRCIGAPFGYSKIDDAWIAQELLAKRGISEITEAQYRAADKRSPRFV